MDKNLLAVTLFPVDIKGSVSDPFESEREIEILTDNSAYKLADQIRIKVSFKNNLSRDIRVVNDGCAVPFFILEKSIGDIWKEIYSPACYSLVPSFVQPTDFKQGEKFTSEIVIYPTRITSKNIIGKYRLYFDLMDKESNKRLPEKFIYSNVFKIVE
jgi:hypothetical protein